MGRDELRALIDAELQRVLSVGPDGYDESSRFVEDLKADSLDLVEILVPVEEHLGVDVGQSGLDRIRTVGQFVDLVAAATASQQ